MDNSTIEQINRIFKTKKLTWCGNFLTVGDPDQELEKGVCYNLHAMDGNTDATLTCMCMAKGLAVCVTSGN